MSTLTNRTELTQTLVPATAFQFCWMVPSFQPSAGNVHWQEMYRLAFEHARAASAAEQFRRWFQVSSN